MEEKKVKVGETEFTLKKPSSKIRKESDSIYAKSYRRAIAEGFFLEAEIENIIKERGIKAANQRYKKEIDEKIEHLESRFNKNDFASVEEGVEKYSEIAELRKELEDLDQAKRELSTQSAAIIAENDRFAYFVYACCFTSENEKVWDTFDDYKNDISEVAAGLSSEMISFIYDGASALLEELAKIRPENIWRASVSKAKEETPEDAKPNKSKKLKPTQ
jgi:hypothetical protein